jgi:hypothetical protein
MATKYYTDLLLSLHQESHTGAAKNELSRIVYRPHPRR